MHLLARQSARYDVHHLPALAAAAGAHPGDARVSAAFSEGGGMSVKALSLVWESFPAGGSELLAMLALADWSDDEGRCWPSMASIARKTRLSRSQSQRIVHQLIADGFLSVTGNETGGAPGSTRQYMINFPTLTGRMGATGSAGATGRMGAREGSHGCGETGSTGATQTVIEPSRTVSAREHARSPAQGGGKKRKSITLATFLDNCKSVGEQAIPADDPIFEYAKTVGIDEGMLAVAWNEFKAYWLSSGKRMIDWRETYRNAIRQNRAGLWFMREGDPAAWTSRGEQARRAAA